MLRLAHEKMLACHGWEKTLNPNRTRVSGTEEVVEDSHKPAVGVSASGKLPIVYRINLRDYETAM